MTSVPEFRVLFTVRAGLTVEANDEDHAADIVAATYYKPGNIDTWYDTEIDFDDITVVED